MKIENLIDGYTWINLHMRYVLEVLKLSKALRLEENELCSLFVSNIELRYMNGD